MVLNLQEVLLVWSSESFMKGLCTLLETMFIISDT